MGIQDLVKVVFSPWVLSTCINKLVAELAKPLGPGRAPAVLVDFSSWMHMAARSYCEYVVAGDFEAAKREAKAYFDRGLGVLRRAGVGRVHFVRDGAPLPAKANVVAKRELVRAEALKAAAESLANLPPQLQLTVPERKAHLKLCQAAVGRLAWLDDYVGEWLKGLSDGDWVVGVETALFEADPQLVHLFSLGGFSCILAEDQDLFVYGVPVAVLSKLNFKTGTCTFLDLAQVPPLLPQCGALAPACEVGACSACAPAAGLNAAGVLEASLLAGTDYCQGKKGWGLKRACKLVRKVSQQLRAEVKQERLSASTPDPEEDEEEE